MTWGLDPCPLFLGIKGSTATLLDQSLIDSRYLNCRFPRALPAIMSSPAAQTEPTHNAPALLEADDDQVDEAYGSDNESAFSASVTSSIRAYRQENGRRYHAYKDGSYMIPNDEVENDRLDFQHAMFQLTLGGKLHLAPIPSDVQNVLDVGTGTGIWAIDFADEYPSASVIGTDLSPIQPGMLVCRLLRLYALSNGV